MMKRLLTIALLVFLALATGCSSRDDIIWLQEIVEPSSPVIPALGDVNEGARQFAVYEYLLPYGTSAQDIKWVGTKEPKAHDKRPLRIGFSQMEVNNDWRVAENNSIFQEAELLGIEIVYRDARQSFEKQKQDLMELIEENVDYIVLAPRQSTGYDEPLEAAKKAEIPVILIDRIIEGEPGDLYITCIMSDPYEIGFRAATILAQKFDNKRICVFEVVGTSSSSSSQLLSAGFRSIADPLRWEIISKDGNFDRADSMSLMHDVLVTDGHRIDAVFTHIDDSAIAAIQAMKPIGIKPGTDIENGEIPIVSMGGYKDALKEIIAGEILATIECSPRFGPILFHFINRLEGSETIPSRIVMPGKTYDQSNALHYINTEGY